MQRGYKWVHDGLRSPTPPCAGPAPRSALKCRANAVMGRESNHRCPLGPDKLNRIFSLDIGIFDLNPAPSTRAPTLRPRARHLGDTQGVLCRVNTGFCRCGGAPQQYRHTGFCRCGGAPQEYRYTGFCRCGAGLQ